MAEQIPTRFPVLLLVLLFLVRGFLLAAVMPPFEAWDEYQHVGYIDRCAQSVGPVVYQQANLDPQFLRAVSRFPRAQEVPLAPWGAVTYAQYWTSGPAPATDGGRSIILYEAQQPPLYYRLMAPIYRLCGGRGNLRLAVSVLRLVNVAFGAIALLLILLWIGRNTPKSLALVMSCWVAFHPMLLLNVTRVANDALAYVLGCAIIVLILSRRRTSIWPHTILIAFLLPAAILAKSTNLTLIPVVMATLLIRGFRREITFSQTILAFSIILAVSAALTWRYFSSNLHHFGLLTSMQETIINRQANRRLLDVLTAMPLKDWLRTTKFLWITQGLWTGGWSFLNMPHVINDSYQIVIVLSALAFSAGILIPACRRRIPIDWSRLWLILFLLASVEAGLMYHAAESYSAWSGAIATNPWYAAVAIPWWMILLCIGAWTLPTPWLRIPLLWSMPITCVIVELDGLLVRMIPLYSSIPLSAESFHRLAKLHPAGMGSTAIVLATLIAIGLLILLIRSAVRQSETSQISASQITEHAGT
jgi:hypothetical protein